MPLVERHGGGAPEHAVLVVALEGWIDAGFAAATAAATLLESIDTRLIATFSSDELVDHRARRPRLRIEDRLNGTGAWLQRRLSRPAPAPVAAARAAASGSTTSFRWISGRTRAASPNPSSAITRQPITARRTGTGSSGMAGLQ